MNTRLKKIYAGLPENVKKILRPVMRNYWYISYLIRYPYYAGLFMLYKNKPIDLTRFQFKVYSEQGEDGVMFAIYKRIGVTNRFLVDFGAGDGVTCNSGFLVKHKKWKSLQMDILTIGAPQVKTERINAENIEILFSKYGVPQEFGLLSIDIDSNDYWVWKAVSHYSPRVVVLEYNSSFSPGESFVVQYDAEFSGDGSSYFGASLLAYSKLARGKGYTLVGCTKKGSNCFFVRSDIVKDNFLLRPINLLYSPTKYRSGQSYKKMMPI